MQGDPHLKRKKEIIKYGKSNGVEEEKLTLMGKNIVL